ncbi:MAG TPA: chemotaxis protein CheW [Candidatus Mucispirillum faecigallinarum]|uniref:Chemotaxis protein CheW n=1 Tax=Candidatus Mucispirillum faecigallinarum TaxID=2838699 RepID=A0A9D2GUX5_9BACT|nr:chemotaxis protein CheW [Candidatus Mucispirillum faecigallinarum]
MSEELFDDVERSEYAEEMDQIQLVGMKLGDEEYAIDVLKITEIIRTVEITIVPRMESYILGVMNLRGKVVPVIDLRVRFNLDRCDFDKSTRIIVVSVDKENIGFVVDEVTEVIRIKRSMVEPTPPLVGSIGQEYILGICKYDSRLIMLLDIDRVINDSGEYNESELRKKMLGSTKQSVMAPISAPEPAPEAQAAPAPAPVQEKPVENTMIPDANSVAAPVIDAPAPAAEPAHEEQSVIETGSADSDVEDNIDALIAKELAMREAETEELNKKKRKTELNPDDVLKDALEQSNAIFKAGEGSQVEQSDLDTLIAKELAKREAETDELNKKHREEKKNTDADIDLSVVDPDAVPMVEIITHPEETEQQKEEERLTPEVGEDKSPAANPASDGESVQVSIKELKRIADKIISGDETGSKIDTNIKGEIGELLRLIIDTKNRVDEIDPLLEKSKENLPNVTSMLEGVNDDTEKATINLMEASDRMADFYKSFISDIAALKKLANKEHESEFMALYEKIVNNLSEAESLGFKILESLEFQDITEQKLRKVIKSIEDMGSRIGTIVGFLQVNDNKSSNEFSRNREQLLVDYGLA